MLKRKEKSSNRWLLWPLLTQSFGNKLSLLSPFCLLSEFDKMRVLSRFNSKNSEKFFSHRNVSLRKGAWGRNSVIYKAPMSM